MTDEGDIYAREMLAEALSLTEKEEARHHIEEALQVLDDRHGSGSEESRVVDTD